MGEAKFTLGPWVAKRRDGSALVIGTDDGRLELAHVWDADDETALPVEANANLFAAAPRMYAALDGVKWSSADKDNMEFTATITYSRMDAIRAALAQARGEQP